MFPKFSLRGELLHFECYPRLPQASMNFVNTFHVWLHSFWEDGRIAFALISGTIVNKDVTWSAFLLDLDLPTPAVCFQRYRYFCIYEYFYALIHARDCTTILDCHQVNLQIINTES